MDVSRRIKWLEITGGFEKQKMIPLCLDMDHVGGGSVLTLKIIFFKSLDHLSISPKLFHSGRSEKLQFPPSRVQAIQNKYYTQEWNILKFYSNRSLSNQKIENIIKHIH